MCAFSYFMSKGINTFMLTRWHEKQRVWRKQDLFQAKSFLILHPKTIQGCPQLQQLIAAFFTLKVGWNILLFSRSNLFFASDFNLCLQSLPPYFWTVQLSGALVPVSLRITHRSRALAELVFHHTCFSVPWLVQCSKLLNDLPHNPKGEQLELILVALCAIQLF